MTGGAPHDIAQRPRPTARLRLVPLGLLVVCVLAAALVGLVVGYTPAPAAPSSAAPPTHPGPRSSLPRSCTLPVRQDLRGRQPWLNPALRAASEKKFARHLAKEQPAYVRGEDGWDFWNDWQVSDMSQSVGRVTLDDQQIHAWAKYLKSLQRAAKRNGSQFYIMVAPAKWDVYPQKLPAWARELRGEVSLDLLMRAHPELPFIDTRSPLRTAARKHDTYEPLDSHWTPYGAYVAWKAATRCLRAADPADKSLGVPPLAGVSLVASSNEYAPYGVPTPASPDRTVPDFAQPLPQVTARSLTSGAAVTPETGNVVDLTQLPVLTRTTDAQSGQRLLVLRDSTGGSLSPLWESSFASTVQLYHGLGATDPPDVGALEHRYKPDITMLVMTERYLGYQPPSDQPAHR